MPWLHHSFLTELYNYKRAMPNLKTPFHPKKAAMIYRFKFIVQFSKKGLPD